jgi:glutamine amidotransferase
MIAIIDSGIANLGSVRRALGELGAEAVVADSPNELRGAERLILPGVGSFSDGMATLRDRGWAEAIRHEVVDNGKRMLGICLGMHLLAAEGSEGGDIAGLGLIPGRVMRLDAMGCQERIPHVGWNEIRPVQAEHKLVSGIPDGTDFYFVHSYAFAPDERADVVAEFDYGVPLVAAIAHGTVWGTQFHPEKSSKAGFRILRNFLDA